MSEPTLSELANIPSDAALGTAGLTDFVPVTRHVNQQIFEAAKFKAGMNWAKYQSDLGNYKDLVKQGQDIQDKDVAPQDREYLQKQLADVFSEIEKNPKNNLGGTGLFSIQEKLSKVASEATQSKQDAAYDLWNRQHIARNPDMATETNKKKIDSYLPSAPLGQRQIYMLDPPDPTFDANVLSGVLEKKNTDTYTKSYVSDATGKPGKGYLYDESGTEFNPTAYVAQWDLALKDDPKIAKAIEFQYNAQPETIKKQFPTKEAWYHQLGVEHAQAIVPPGTEQELTEKKNVRYGKKSKISRDPSALDWYKARTERINATKPTGSRAESKPPPVIEAPAVLFGEHINTLKKGFADGNTKEIVINYPGTDPKTRLAIGLKEGGKVHYKPDGGYLIINADGSQSVGTIDNVLQGFIGAVKTTDLDPTTDKDGQMAQGFQTNSENYFKQLHGTTSGRAIWDNWGVDKGVQNDNQAGSTKPTTGKSLKFPDGSVVDIQSSGLSDAEIKVAIKAGAKYQ